jgi:hypothetical protein
MVVKEVVYEGDKEGSTVGKEKISIGKWFVNHIYKDVSFLNN